LYIGPGWLGHKGQHPVDLAAHRILHIGPAQAANRLDFPTPDRVLYIGPLASGATLSLDAGVVVCRDVMEVSGPVTPQVSRMLVQPSPGLGITVTKNIWIGSYVMGLRMIMPRFPACGARTGLLDREGPGMGMIVAAAIVASFGGRHRHTSTVLVPAGRASSNGIARHYFA
jgi:hypothetical protein